MTLSKLALGSAQFFTVQGTFRLSVTPGELRSWSVGIVIESADDRTSLLNLLSAGEVTMITPLGDTVEPVTVLDTSVPVKLFPYTVEIEIKEVGSA